MISTEENGFFDKFEDVYENRHQYSIEWAFKDAQNKLDEFKEKTIDGKLKKKCLLCKDQSKINKKYIKFKKDSMYELKKQRWYSRLFSNSYTLLTVIEFILSIMLVLIVSEISHSSGAAVESEIFSLSVVTIFAFLKVFLERYLIKPKLEQIGWKIYLRTVNVLKSMTEEFDEQVSLDIDTALTQVA